MRQGIPTARGSQRKLFLRQLQNSLNVEKFLEETMGISEYWESGAEISHRCNLPFGMHGHGDRNPSASFNREYLLENCWVCGGGDIFWWVSNVKGISIEEAIQTVGLSLVPTEMTYSDFISELESYWQEAEDVVISMPHYSVDILKQWKKYSTYLDGRGVSREVQQLYSTGVDLKNRDLFKFGRREEWVDQARVVIPLFDRGILRGWLKRKIEPTQIGPKYKNSPGLPRQYVLFGADQVEDKSELIVVESSLSVLRLRSLGYENVVATLGAKVTNEQQHLIRQYDKILVWMDPDSEGRKSSKKLVEDLHKHSQVWSIQYEEGDNRDPAEFDSRDEVEKFIERSKTSLF
jgi:DNA primase